jgi:hypothetical protein
VSQTASTVSSNQPDEATGGIGHDQADELRAALVRELRDEGVIVSEPVAEALAGGSPGVPPARECGRMAMLPEEQQTPPYKQHLQITHRDQLTASQRH